MSQRQSRKMRQVVRREVAASGGNQFAAVWKTMTGCGLRRRVGIALRLVLKRRNWV